MRRFLWLICVCLSCVYIQAGTVVINEFMALNASVLQDEDGDYSDWIELYYEGDSTLSLQGWALTDKADHSSKWVFPEITMAPGEYLLVYASGKDRQDVAAAHLHTNFKLSGSGEYLGLLDADGNVIYDYTPYFPAQQTDVAYGLYLGQACFLTTPTPGTENVLGDQILKPVFSVEGGFFESPFQLALSVVDTSFRIYYTLDGTRPTAENAQLYQSPILLTTTTPVSAVCVNAENLHGEVLTHTYLCLADILQQPASIDGYPQEWGYLSASEMAPADYGMDATVTESDDYKDMIASSLTEDIPSLCIVTNPGYLFSHSEDPDTGGIYIYTGKGVNTIGEGWERPASVEYYDPQTGGSFQINCGLLLHGGNSRNPSNSPKHSFRISFRKMYDASKLNYRIFNNKEATERFDHLVLRAGYNYSWLKNGSTTLYPQNIIQRTNAQYILDPFAKEAHRKMGQLITHRRFVHLYLNGIYWGVYDLCEKINNDFAQSYLGGEDEDYDVIGDHNEIFDGTNEVYNQMLSLAKEVGSDADDANYQQLVADELLDLENFIDYMLVNYYIGNKDWDNNNWRAVRNRENPDKGFRFLVWDAETAFTDVDLDLLILKSGHPTVIMNALKNNPEFRLLCADRIYKHLFNGGVLSPEGAASLYASLAGEIDQAIACESARWGDYRQELGDASVVYTRNDHWLPRKEDLLQNYFPQRTAVLLQQLKDAGLYPSIDPPVFSLAAGTYEDTVKTAVTAAAGEVYYTLDGTDPRVSISSAVAAAALRYADSLTIAEDVLLKARAKDGSIWSALAETAYALHLPDTVVTPPDTVITPPDTIPVEPDGLLLPENRMVASSCIDGSIHYLLPSDGPVEIRIFRMDGKMVAVMNEHEMTAGYHQTPRIELQAGMYLYRLRFNGKEYIGKMMLR